MIHSKSRIYSFAFIAIFLLLIYNRSLEAVSLIEISSYSSDISIKSPGKITITHQLQFETDNTPFKDFKIVEGNFSISKEQEKYSCSTETGSSFQIERTPRADGITHYKIKMKRPVLAKKIICFISGAIKEEDVENLLKENTDGTYHLQLSLPAPLLLSRSLTVTIHFPVAITPDDVRPDEITSEEFEVQYFPSALTLSSHNIPPNRNASLELIISENIIKEKQKSNFLEYSLKEIDKYADISSNWAELALSSYILVALFLMVTFLLIVTIGVKTSGEYIFFSAITIYPRILITLCFFLFHLFLSGSSYFIFGNLSLLFAVVLNTKNRREPVENTKTNFKNPIVLIFIIAYVCLTALLTIYHWKNHPLFSLILLVTGLLCSPVFISYFLHYIKATGNTTRTEELISNRESVH